MYDAILVPTDGSPAAERAVDHAVELATTFGATVHALYVVDVALYSSLEAGVDAVIDALEREGESAVEAVETRCAAAGIETETEVVIGPVHRAIRDYVTEHDIDLVVMGTHGRQGVERFLLGSVTERTVRTSPAPVLTVGPDDEDATAESGSGGNDADTA
ncbi:universal stress protein [Salinigranum marinum]|uniref:universal stress protein n=1 Tax=Salinigranum marinum TaxID=1515595 RepID=UPI002989B0D3|nr:universal stress protein [Salinigranum marinum]